MECRGYGVRVVGWTAPPPARVMAHVPGYMISSSGVLPRGKVHVSPSFLGALRAGPSMLARRLTTVLPAMPLTGDPTAVVTTRPFRGPPPVYGRWGADRRPGAHAGPGSRAHHGVLGLDARPGCRRHGLAGLRQPLEKSITYIQSPARHRRLCANQVSGVGEAFASRSHPAREYGDDSLALMRRATAGDSRRREQRWHRRSSC
jgi:hypothetical protein